MYVDETDVIGFAKKYELPVCKNPCPVDGQTRRAYAKNLVRQLNQENPGAQGADVLCHCKWTNSRMAGKISGIPGIPSEKASERNQPPQPLFSPGTGEQQGGKAWRRSVPIMNR